MTLIYSLRWQLDAAPSRTGLPDTTVTEVWTGPFSAFWRVRITPANDARNNTVSAYLQLNNARPTDDGPINASLARADIVVASPTEVTTFYTFGEGHTPPVAFFSAVLTTRVIGTGSWAGKTLHFDCLAADSPQPPADYSAAAVKVWDGTRWLGMSDAGAVWDGSQWVRP